SIGLVDKLQKIQLNSSKNYGTSRFSSGYKQNDSTVTWQKDTRSPSLDSTSLEKTNSISKNYTQPNNEDSISNICFDTSPIVHTTPLTIQESVCQDIDRLGHTTTFTEYLFEGTPLVDEQSEIMERSKFSTTDTTTDNLCGRKQHRLGVQSYSEQATSDSSWILESQGIEDVYQLEGTNGSIPLSENLSTFTQHENIDSDGQYNINVIPEQTRRNEIITIDESGDNTLEMVSETGNYNSIQPCEGDTQYSSRLRIKKTISEESMDDKQTSISTDTINLGSKRHRPFCGQTYKPAKKIRIMATRSGEPIHRRLHDTLDNIPESLPKSSLESDKSMSPQTNTGENTTSNYDNTLVDISTLVPNSPILSNHTTNYNRSIMHRNTYSENNMAYDKQELETRRMEIINSKYNSSKLNDNAKNLFINRYTTNNETNKSYRRGHHLFIQWASNNNISMESFNATDLINFLSDIHTEYHYAYSTLQLIRSAVSNLHPNPNSLKQNKDLNDFFVTLAKLAPPIKTHKPTINIQPTFNHLKQQNNNTISLSKLQAKLAFLLAVTCFFRTSDLHRIP
ncbi:hypothetical protein BJ944DRAFT_130421, partial [Cunninghamella echinulata]